MGGASPALTPLIFAKTLHPAYPLGVFACDLPRRVARQSADQSQDALHVADVVREVRAVKHVVAAADGDAHFERTRLVDDGVVKNAAKIFAGRRLDGGAAGRNGLVAAVEPAAEIGQRAAA